jgi:NAD-dependent dihydropyrimidine dehydrogenase PreA subunit
MVTRMISIRIDDGKCTSANECRVCLDGCPQGIFQIRPAHGRVPGVATKDWIIRPLFPSLCTACNVCYDICPQKAITVSV